MTGRLSRAWPFFVPASVMARAIVAEAARELGVADVEARSPLAALSAKFVRTVEEIALRTVPRRTPATDKAVFWQFDRLAPRIYPPDSFGDEVLHRAALAVEGRSYYGESASSEDAVERARVLAEHADDVRGLDGEAFTETMRRVLADMEALASGRLRPRPRDAAHFDPVMPGRPATAREMML
ncbi:MAG: hypothetical protein AB7P02_15780 [Alphaproteobacteria bacterium]